MSRKSNAKRGLPARFVSRQAQTLEASSKGIDSKLADLQRESERIAREREALDARRESAPNVTLIELSALEFDASAQSRVFVDPQVVADYVERMSWDEKSQRVIDPEGVAWQPVLAIFDGENHWVADGFHRAAAAREAGIELIQCEVRKGDLRDAVRYSLSANARHGLRRTREDKRRAVTRALEDAEWRLWTDARIAELCSVSRPFVSNMREELEVEGQIPVEIALYGADDREFERDVEAIEEKRAARAKEGAAPGKAKKPKLSLVTPPSEDERVEEPSRRVLEVGWSELELEALEDVEVLVLYPASAAHYELVADWLMRGDHDIELLVIPTMSGSPWFWKGPAILDSLTEVGFGQPQLCHFEEFGKHFTLWINGARATGLSKDWDVSSIRAREHVAIIGQSLDPWS